MIGVCENPAANKSPKREAMAFMPVVAQKSESPFLQGYVKVLIDAVNLRCAVRAARLGRGGDFLAKVLLPGGSVSADAILAARGEGLTRLFSFGPLAEAAALGAEVAAPGSAPLTAFERACDNGVTAYMSAARRVPFGEQIVAGYLYARECELTAIRIILSGRLAGLEGDVIRERLRDPYV